MPDKSIESFYQILNFFKTANYLQKVEFMQKNWGNVKYDMLIEFDKTHNIQITIDANKKYHFNFSSNKIEFDEVEKYLPQYAQLILDGKQNDLQEFDANLSSIELNEKDTTSTTNSNNSCLPEESPAKDIEIKNDLLNIYNGIAINKHE